MPTITLNEKDHTYLVDGEPRTAVTDALRDLKRLEDIPDDNLLRARERGRFADAAVMLYVDDNLDEDDLDPVLVPYLTGWKKAVARYGIRVLEKQRRVYHGTYQYAGTLDLLVDMDRRPPHLRGNGLIIIDVKCTVEVGPEVGLQLAAYEHAYNYEIEHTIGGFDAPRVRHRLGLQLVDINGGDFSPHWFTERTDFMTFVGCLYRHNWRLKHGYAKRTTN